MLWFQFRDQWVQSTSLIPARIFLAFQQQRGLQLYGDRDIHRISWVTVGRYLLHLS